MQTSEAIEKISAAVVKAQGEIKHAVKDSVNPHFKAKYADLGSVWAAVRPALIANELAALQDFGISDGGVGVKTRLVHSSGQWIEFDSVSIPVSKKDAQGVGSAITYARRYSLSAALGVVADEDDDGNAAAQTPATRVADAQPAKPAAEVDKVKNPPGRSKAVTDVRELCRNVMACSDGDELMALLNQNENKKLALTICGDFPRDWQGEAENSGLAGIVMYQAQQLKCADAETWVHKAEQKVRASQPKQAAE